MAQSQPPQGPAAGSTGASAAEGAGRPRELWTSRFGFIMAAVGSAVGLGNMWRFSYLTAEEGGAAFVLLYIIMTLVLGIPILIAELAVGRRTRLSPIGALRAAGGRGWAPLGYVFVAVGAVILAYYSVIAGWVTRYALTGILGGFPGEPGEFFGSVATGMPAIAFHLLFMALTVGVVMGGIKGGIERVSVVMMPVLFVLIVGLALWAATLEGSGSGYSFYLAPNLDELFEASTLANAASQAFFSLSLGMGAMLTFASYLSRQTSLPRESGIIAFTDFLVAFVAGMVTFPVIFALGLQAAVGESTVGALFISLPGAFVRMGPVVGRIVGTVFFVALFIGALTSAISLLEVVTSSLIDEWRLPRKVAALGAGAVIALLGFWPASNLNALGAMDAVASNVMLPFGALALAIFVGWRMRDPLAEVSAGASAGLQRLLRGWLVTLRFLVPMLMVIVLYYMVQTAWAAVSALAGVESVGQ